jgi:hypothetical protein
MPSESNAPGKDKAKEACLIGALSAFILVHLGPNKETYFGGFTRKPSAANPGSNSTTSRGQIGALSAFISVHRVRQAKPG